MEWWQQYDCPACGATLCNCDCLELQQENLWRYYDCDGCGVEAGTKCQCPTFTFWGWIKSWFMKVK